MKHIFEALTQTAVLLVSSGLALAQQPAVQERVAALKTSVGASQATLKQHEWIETTVVSVKGEEKARQMNRCYHGADGNMQKVPVTSPPPQEKKRGLRGKIAEAKKEEMTDYMKQAVALVKMYVPPGPGEDPGGQGRRPGSLTPLPNQRARLTFADYLKAGDSLALEVDLANNRPLAAKVASVPRLTVGSRHAGCAVQHAR